MPDEGAGLVLGAHSGHLLQEYISQYDDWCSIAHLQICV